MNFHQKNKALMNSNMSSDAIQIGDDDAVLSEATLNAAQLLGLTRTQLGKVLGRDRSRLKSSIRVDSKAGELALLLIRVYRALYAMVDGDDAVMQHWMRTPNTGTGGTPAEQVQSVQGLTEVLAYLDAIRGKV